MTAQLAAQRIRDYVTENFLYMRPGLVLGDGDSLLQTGVLDSMGVIELLTFVETELGVTVADDDITEDAVGTIAALASYVATHSA